MTIFALVLAVLAAYTLYAWSIYRRYKSDRKAEQIIFARTEDGVAVALHRYLPKGKVKRNHPIILCHGFGANRFNIDFDDRVSLAAWLANRGFDCFVLELRGSGWSMPPNNYPGGRWNIHMEDFIHKDIPTVIDKVKSLTGAEKIHWVGHSMGGMVHYAYTIENGSKRIQSATTIGSPANFRYLDSLQKVSRRFGWLLKYFPALHQRVYMFFLLPIAGRFNDIAGRGFVWPENSDMHILRSAVVNLVANLPSPLTAQFAGYILEGEFKSSAGRSWQNDLTEVEHPVFCLAGSKDFFARPEGIGWVYEKLGSPDKKLRIFGKAYGDSTEYGHGDLVLGLAAPAEVYPEILQWLEQWD